MNEFFDVFMRYVPWFWVGVTVICLVIESLTLSLTTIWFAAGAFCLIFISLAPIPFPWQILIFAFISLILFIYTRPILKNRLMVKKTATNVDSIIGKHVLVLKKITALEKGSVKLNGIEWTAKSEDDSEIAENSECVIVSVEGVTVVVKQL